MSFVLTLIVVHWVAMMTPGPDIFLISQTAMSRSRIEALCVVAGITLGGIVWASLALIGLQWIFEKWAWLHSGLLTAGGLYLLWMGYNLLKGALSRPSGTAGEAATEEVPVSKHRAFLKGLFTNLSNVKVVIYFSSIFTMMLTPDMTAAMRWGVLAIVVAETFLWFTIVALIFGLPVIRRGYLRVARWIDGLAGALFCGFGLALLWEAKQEML